MGRKKMKLKNNRSNPINLSSKSVRYNKKNNDIYTNILSEIDRKTNYYHSQKRKRKKKKIHSQKTKIFDATKIGLKMHSKKKKYQRTNKPDIDNIDNIIC